MRIEQGVAWVDLPGGEFRTATPGECAARIAELEAALRPFADLLSRPWETRGSCHQAVSYDDVARAAALLGSKQS